MATKHDTWIEGDCGYDDAAAARDEARDEYIDDNAPALAEKLVGSEDFAEHAFRNDLDDDNKDWVLAIAGRFVEAMENAPDTEADLA